MVALVGFVFCQLETDNSSQKDSIPSCYIFIVCSFVVVLVSWIQLFWDTKDCSPPGSSVRGITQARILEWVTISFPWGSSQPRTDPTSLALKAESLPLSHRIVFSMLICLHFEWLALDYWFVWWVFFFNWMKYSLDSNSALKFSKVSHTWFHIIT